MPIVEKTNKYIDELNEAKGLSVKHGDDVLDCLNNILEGTGDLEKRHKDLDSAVYDTLTELGSGELRTFTIINDQHDLPVSMNVIVPNIMEYIDGKLCVCPAMVVKPTESKTFYIPCGNKSAGARHWFVHTMLRKEINGLIGYKDGVSLMYSFVDGYHRHLIFRVTGSVGNDGYVRFMNKETN